jgi:SET domain-containing protein
MDCEYEPKEVIQKDTEKKGMGLFALVDIMEGDFIIEYVGTIVKESPDSIYGMKYCFSNLWVDTELSESLSKYLNHSHDPNCRLEQHAVKGLPHLFFLATKNIKKDEELTFDYQRSLNVKDELEYEKE